MADELLLCYNKGCGKRYKEEDNHDSACIHHPGVPVFHDALKGWSCCKKRSTDFTDFLHIPGCTTGAHNPVKPPEPEKTKEKPLAVGEEIVVKAPRPKVTKRPPDDLPYAPLQVKVANSLKTLLAKMKTEEKEQVDGDASKKKEEEIDGNEEVKIGTTCKNKGCSTTYLGPDTDFTRCRYHSGAPIFHEGYKYWTCCQKRTSDFNEFLKQEGCTTGDHVWTETEKKIANCRYDWHQTGSFVIISIYAKACVPEHCSFQVNPTNVRISIFFGNGKSEYQMDLKLHGAIEPARSSVELLGAKVEVKLRKADPLSWATLEQLEK